MHDYKTISLDIRDKGQNIIFAGKAPKKSKKNDCSFGVGNVVTIQKSGVQILVKVTQQCQNDEWVGTVVGFENWDQDNIEGICVDDEITFCESNVFTCTTEAHVA